MSAHRILHDLLIAPFLVPDPGNAGTITIDRWGMVVPIRSGANAETRRLAQPTKAGLLVMLVMDVDGGGDVTVTITGGYSHVGDADIVLNDAGDFVALLSVKAGASCYWRAVSQDGTNLLLPGVTARTLKCTGSEITSLALAAAAGSTQANATALSATVDNFLISAADATKGVKLPAASAGRRVFLKNDANAVLKVYPVTGGKINALADNASLDMAANTAAIFVGVSATRWVTCPLLPS